jgi:hypothetical protein
MQPVISCFFSGWNPLVYASGPLCYLQTLFQKREGMEALRVITCRYCGLSKDTAGGRE